MSLPPLAEVSDVQTLIGETKPITDTEQCEMLIRIASARARAYAKSRWATDAEPPVLDVDQEVTDVVAAMVVRAMQNPLGVTQETTGPFNASYGSDAASRIYLTSGEKDILDQHREKSRLWALSPTRGVLETPAVHSWNEELDVPENEDILQMLHNAEPA